MLVALVVFVGVFLVIALLLLAMVAGSSRSKQAREHLETAVWSNSAAVSEQKVDLKKIEVLSTIPWIDRQLRSLKIAHRLRVLLYQANLRWTPNGFLLAIAVCFVIPSYAIKLQIGHPAVAALAGLVCAYLPVAYVRHRRTKRFEAFDQSLPAALDLMVNGLRAGHSLVSVLRLVAQEAPDPLGTEFRICFEEQNYGLELRTAMENMAERFPLQDLRIAITAILIQKESGGNLAEVLEKTSSVIRERFKLKRQVRVHSAQSRLTGWILSFLPLVLGIGLYVIDPQMMSILWTRKIGQELLLASAVMTAIGGLIIRQIVNMEV